MIRFKMKKLCCKLGIAALDITSVNRKLIQRKPFYSLHGKDT